MSWLKYRGWGDANFPYACFGCRRSFKRTVSSDFLERPAVLPCPHCGGAAIGLSRKFKAPKQGDVAQWKKVHALVLGGCLFYSYNDPYPETLGEVPAFLRDRREMIEKDLARFPAQYAAVLDAAQAVVIP
jgi:DNA-directed RNA polymerase subunit RPC12/RpoP